MRQMKKIPIITMATVGYASLAGSATTGINDLQCGIFNWHNEKHALMSESALPILYTSTIAIGVACSKDPK
jgi:hypothetical protein